MSKQNNNNVMNIDEAPKGREGIEEMLERINAMDEDISHSEESVKNIA